MDGARKKLINKNLTVQRKRTFHVLTADETTVRRRPPLVQRSNARELCMPDGEWEE
jgi:hypothetical protein